MNGITRRHLFVVSSRCYQIRGPLSPATKSPLKHQQRIRFTSTEASSSKPHSDAKTKPKRSFLRGFILSFLVGVPIGWVFHTWQSDGKGKPGVAKPTDFAKYALINKEDVSSTCSIFTLKPAASMAIELDELQGSRAITSVQIKQPQLQIARWYTILPPVEGQDPQELRFLIRREHNGEVSGYLHRLSLGSEIEMRGPGVEYVLPDNVQRVIFLAGGTGIAPAMQVADKTAGDADVHILWASRRREDCTDGVSTSGPPASTSSWSFPSWRSMFGTPAAGVTKTPPGEATNAVKNPIVLQLNRLRDKAGAEGDHHRVIVDYFVDEEGSFVRPDLMTRLLRYGAQNDRVDDAAKCLVFVSGPEGFVKYWAGPKQWVNGQEVQGPLGGVLSTLDLRGWEVVKL